MDPSVKSYMNAPQPAPSARSFLPEGLKTGLILALVAGVAYLVYDGGPRPGVVCTIRSSASAT